jgi:DNA-binding PucR family transcriptional regulator
MKAIDCDTDCALLPHEKNSIYEIIVRMFERMNVDVFIEKVLGEIMRHDKKNNSELLNTLEHFIMATSIKNVAAELFIHPNTVLWRKQKIEEILSCDMENIDVRSEINIAFKLMRVRNFLQIAR